MLAYTLYYIFRQEHSILAQHSVEFPLEQAFCFINAEAALLDLVHTKIKKFHKYKFYFIIKVQYVIQ